MSSAPSAAPLVEPVRIHLTRPEPHWAVTRPRPGVVLIRSAAAATPEPADWADVLAGFLRIAPNVVAVGAKRLEATSGGGQGVFSMGEFVIHPKGFHHHGQGVVARCFRFVEEIDVVTGGVAAIDENAFDAAGGEDVLNGGELGAIELGLRLLKAGGRCVVVPQVVVSDASTPNPSHDEEIAFRGRWGFDWKAADLDAVREHHAGSGLLWNVRYHAPGMPFEKYRDRGGLVWESYEKADVFRQRAHHIAKLAARMCPPGSGRLLDCGSGDGFFSHMFASQGIEVVGVDPEELGVRQARLQTGKQQYPGKRPTFMVGRGTCLPIATGSVRGVSLMDVIEHLPNPVAVLREIARVLRPGGHAMIITPSWQFGGSSDATYHLMEYTMPELVRQVGAIGGLKVVDTGMISGVYRDLVVIAQRI